MRVKNPARGTVAQSLQGRDKGALYVVLEEEGNFLYLADGKVRKLENPKRKNVKHVRLFNKNVAECGLSYPWDKSFNDRAAYYLKQIGAETPKVRSEE